MNINVCLVKNSRLNAFTHQILCRCFHILFIKPVDAWGGVLIDFQMKYGCA